MNIAHSIPSTVSSVSFSFLTTQDIRRISVKQIVNPVLLDDLNRPNIGGLYDPALGPSEQKDICATCRLTYYTCPGHFGHIELPAPVFHPLFMMNMYNLLRGTCFFCHKFKMSRTQKIKFIAKLRLLEHGLLDSADVLDGLTPRVSKSGEEDGQETKANESVADFEKRVNVYVYLSLSRSATTRDNYKDGQVYQARKDVISAFLKATITKRCQNQDCCAHGYTFRKEGHTKIIEYDLSTKQKRQHDTINLKRPNVLQLERHSRRTQAGSGQDLEGSQDDASDSEESEGTGEPIFSDSDGDNSASSRIPDTVQLPRAANGKVKTIRGRNERVIPPEECRAHLRLLFANEGILCSLLYGRHGPFSPISPSGISIASADMFFMEVLAVAPTRFRPPAKLGESLFEHPQNELLSKVLSTSYKLRDVNDELKAASIKGAPTNEALQKKLTGQLLDSLVQLQVDVNSFIDSSKNPAPVRQGKLPPQGVKQGLEKKEGLFRKNMMGKRVNYAARSVISPDVNIEPNEIGVPPVFARKLTFPEPVTTMNIHRMRELVINGPHEYPGATMVEFEDGSMRSLSTASLDERKAIANQLLTPQDGRNAALARPGLSTRTMPVNKKVYRHLQDGDILILNRQPTLHKPSMMAHRARVLQGEKTIRMHYANCNSYNADFDGDEMNIHFPQNEVARAEAMFIANTDNQYLVPTSGKPLRGLIQDHVVAGVWMTSRDAFFSREDYQQLLYGALRPEENAQKNGLLVTLPPAIWKPLALWTGKQIITTVLLNITPSHAEGLNLYSTSKVNGNLWGKGSEEGKVIVMDGELLCGILDKSQFGATDYGLVHSVYELYGGNVAGKLLGILSRLFSKFLQHRAFTCRMDDLALTPEGNSWRVKLLNDGKNLGTEGAVENFPSLVNTSDSEKHIALAGFLQEVLRDDEKMAGLDMTVKTKLAGLTKDIADACMPRGLLRQFPHNHMQTMTQSGAKGSAVNAQQISCALGQQELEGRRVPVMVSGKTLPSFKPFETAAIAGGYIASRFLTGVRPQEFYFHCMAGREGLIDTAVKTSRSGYLQRCLIKHLEGIRVHYDHTVRGSDSSVYQFHYGGDSLDVTKQKHLYEFEFNARNIISLVNRLRPKDVAGAVDDTVAVEYMKKVLKKNHKSKRNDLPPPLAIYSPSTFLGATSEKFAEEVEKYIKANPHQVLKPKHAEIRKFTSRKELVPSKRFRMLMNVLYMRSLIDPGEAVGLLAAQGVGEPSTQMTLNTFHFAGHGAANVTLGIPRLREIVMTASQKPKTPSMKLNVRSGTLPKQADSFCKRASRLCLSQVVDQVTVKERLAQSRRKQFLVDISFYPKEEYLDAYDVTPSELLAAFGAKFPLILKKEIQAELKKLASDIKSQLAELGKGRATRETAPVEQEDEDEPMPRRDDEGSEIGDGDAEDAKRARQTKQQATYESDDEDDGGAWNEYDDVAIEAEYDEPDEDVEMDEATAKQVKGDNLKAQVQAARVLFQENVTLATAFAFTDMGASFELEFASETPKLLLLGIVERTCRKTIVREIPGIVDCFQVKEDSRDSQIKLVTNGSNLPGMWEFSRAFGHDLIDVNNIYTNDIYAGLRTYGVEMARAVILKEVQGVFGAYKIDVDMRHLELIADYMTFDGGYKPFNRKGISASSSPLLKASYETTAAFLSDATLHGDYDDLTTPSGNIVLGRPSLSGTGVFDIMQPLPRA